MKNDLYPSDRQYFLYPKMSSYYIVAAAACLLSFHYFPNMLMIFGLLLFAATAIDHGRLQKMENWYADDHPLIFGLMISLIVFTVSGVIAFCTAQKLFPEIHIALRIGLGWLFWIALVFLTVYCVNLGHVWARHSEEKIEEVS